MPYIHAELSGMGDGGGGHSVTKLSSKATAQEEEIIVVHAQAFIFV